MGIEKTGPDGRRQRTLRSREAMVAAATDLLFERGLDGVTVEEIAERAGVTRRTFSRHFPGKEEAILGEIGDSGHTINDALRGRPADEAPLMAYWQAVCAWLADEFGGHRTTDLSRRIELFRRIDREPALFAAFQHLRIDAEEESVRIIAGRLGVDPAVDPRPAVTVGTGAGTLTAVLRAWARGGDPDALPALAGKYFGALTGLLPGGSTGQQHTQQKQHTQHP
ncbi:TetR/AcrR family transcriptional regulator [Streptomyces beijiangensis]|uniref:TetR family transcriptional regulator n=1 Tax=Streptomyces beijiangensis TaxID=163361 RepID=A0A939F7L6_9ACTN|nr:TetR/AcrR family transcriptional regulator [Streptomyces beijiangensis]MBO0514056.1 TetR family transcriptional regulator [Streptomyces beijiangensis]